jgi:hypothetical protein
MSRSTQSDFAEILSVIPIDHKQAEEGGTNACCFPG